jgi:predicted RNA binding protein YcfA (HicA-like mRNA interferase family)
MPKPKNLSGDDIVKIFGMFGFEVVSQKGSHVKMCRFVADYKQILIVPLHKEIKKGTLVEIFKQASRFIPESDLKQHFYNE